MDPRNKDYQILALAGVAQAAILITQYANGLNMNPTARSVLINSTRAESSVEKIFEYPENYRIGAKSITALLKTHSDSTAHQDIHNYSRHLLLLGSHLRKNKRATAELGKQLLSVPTSDEVNQLANIYENILAPLVAPIYIYGERELLEQSSTAANIRSMLLAGVRFSWLWHQMGGRGWHLSLRKRFIIKRLELLTGILIQSGGTHYNEQ